MGLTYKEFCKLPSSDPEKCRLIFDLEDLVFRLINAERFIEQAKEQNELIQERGVQKENTKEITMDRII